MNFFYFFILNSIYYCFSMYNEEKPFIRGLSPTDQITLKYNKENFTCRDGSLIIPFNQVNDNYCDCPDNSDEPGTPACPKGFFYCENKNYKGKKIFSSRVLDGICDCCDGSDEEGKVYCPNTCKELAKEIKEKMVQKIHKYKQGIEKKKEYISQAKKELEEKKVLLEKLKMEISLLQKEKTNVEERKKIAEQKEQEMRLLIEQKKNQSIKNLPHIDIEEATENIISSENNLTHETTHQNLLEENIIENKEENKTENEENEELKPFIEAVKIEKEKKTEIEQKIFSIEKEIQEIEDIQKNDYGKNHEFYLLSKQCFQVNSVEYIYELCPFKRVTQKLKHGGSETSLGKWDISDQSEEWIKYHTSMFYSNGQKCWGGPDRTTKVQILCNSDNELVDPQEPNKCEYSMKLYTPAACDETTLATLELNLKNENFDIDFLE
jgi:protein kinase C substrate 80K-H